MTERELFEEWARERNTKGYAFPLAQCSSGYRCYSTNDAWLAWQAGRRPLLAEVERLKAAMPSWHERPTQPGLWLTFGKKPRDWSYVAVRLDAEDISRGAPFETVAVFGPIPEQPLRRQEETMSSDPSWCDEGTPGVCEALAEARKEVERLKSDRENLAIMLRRVIRQAPALRDKACDLLRRMGLNGSILRQDTVASAAGGNQ